MRNVRINGVRNTKCVHEYEDIELLNRDILKLYSVQCTVYTILYTRVVAIGPGRAAQETGKL